jgi:hypothetical protein
MCVGISVDAFYMTSDRLPRSETDRHAPEERGSGESDRARDPPLPRPVGPSGGARATGAGGGGGSHPNIPRDNFSVAP